MDYDKAVKHYIRLRDENKAIEAEANAKVAENKEKMEKLAVWLQLKAEKDGLDKIPTTHGTVFWTTVNRCSVSNQDEFFAFVKKNEAWELMEKRASKTAVADYVESFKSIPPGVDFSTVKQINVRSK